jgi:lysosomal Pro-X carboxypeptidase
MATKAKPSILVSSLIIILNIFSSQPSLASQPSNSPSSSSSRWAPRFLGRFSQPPNHNHRHQQQQKYQYETRYFSQRLDHFSFSELPRFPQRYLINTEHWVGSQRLGPIFLYCGNEGDIEWFAANTGFVWEIAPRFGAMVVFPEVSLFFFFCSCYWKTRIA